VKENGTEQSATIWSPLTILGQETKWMNAWSLVEVTWEVFQSLAWYWQKWKRAYSTITKPTRGPSSVLGFWSSFSCSYLKQAGLTSRGVGLADTCYLVMCLLFQTVKTAHELTDWLPALVQGAWPYIEPYIWPMASTAQTCNVWLVVVLTADRYIAICRPLHAAQYRWDWLLLT